MAHCTIVRLEHPASGLGPLHHLYDSGQFQALENFYRICGHTLLTPLSDPRLRPVWETVPGQEKRAFLFGAADVAAITAYFSPDAVRWLLNRGFVLAVYRVPEAHVLFGTNQIAFRRSEATHAGCCRFDDAEFARDPVFQRPARRVDCVALEM